MNKVLLATLGASSLLPFTLSARELWCEKCEPQVEDCSCNLFVERSQLFVDGEFLYWTVAEPLLDYAIQTKPGESNGTFALGNYQVNSYEYQPGFRLALSYYRCNRYWELEGQYTWFKDKGTDKTFAPLNPVREVLISLPFVEATNSLDFHYQLGDLYVSRVFDPNPHLRMKLFGGATGGEIKQTMHTAYTNQIGDIEQIKETWNFWGAGLRLGLMVDWFWWCQFYLTARASFATLVGVYETKLKHSIVNSGLILGDSKWKDTRPTFNAQFLVGPSWQKVCDCWSFELFAGYEFNLWSNLQERHWAFFTLENSFKPTVETIGALCLHGLTARLTLGF